MNKKMQERFAQFTDREISYILQYAEMFLDKSHAPDDGTKQGSILKRLKQVIYGVKL